MNKMLPAWIARASIVILISAAAACSSDDKTDTDGGSNATNANNTNTGTPDGGDGDGGADDGSVEKDGLIPTGDYLSQEYLEQVTAYLASDELEGREEGTPGGIAARKFIIGELERCGVKPAGENGTFEQKITTGKGVNVLGMIEGTGTDEEKKRKVLISAHYDHLGVYAGDIYNGAYDNAAAVALMLGVACTYAKNPPLRSILVASWDAEEPKTFLTSAMGSQFFVSNPLVPLEEIDAVIVFELAGGDIWKDAGLYFAVGSEKSPQVTAAVKAAEVPVGLTTFRLGVHLAEEQPTGHQPWSDYDAFRNKGVPFLLLTDAQTKVYHTPKDTMDNLVKSKLPLEAAYAKSIVETLAQAQASDYTKATFVAKSEDYTNDAVEVVALLERALATGGIVDSLGLNATSKAKLQADLTASKQIRDSLSGGGQPTSQGIAALRIAAQRLMCLAGTTYPEFMCSAI